MDVLEQRINDWIGRMKKWAHLVEEFKDHLMWITNKIHDGVEI